MNNKVILLTKLFMAIALGYGAYLIKTAAGINLSSRHSAPKIFKLPLLAIDDPIGSYKTNLKSKIKRVRNYL